MWIRSRMRSIEWFISNDLEWLITRVSRSWYFVKANILKRFYIVELQIIHLLNFRCNVPLACVPGDSWVSCYQVHMGYWEVYELHCVSIKNKQNYFCYNYVKLPPNLTILGTKMTGLISITLLKFASSIRQKAPQDLIILWFKCQTA